MLHELAGVDVAVEVTVTVVVLLGGEVVVGAPHGVATARIGRARSARDLKKSIVDE